MSQNENDVSKDRIDPKSGKISPHSMFPIWINPDNYKTNPMF